MIKVIRSSILAMFAIFSFAMIATAQTAPSQFPGIGIKNFGQMAENYFRGAQPMPDDYKSLADLGITTIIDLRNDPTDYEKSAAEAVGIRYINIPMSGWKTPKDRDVEQFLKIANDPTTGKFFVHCKAGIHRTGVVGAAFRMTNENWDYDKAYREMKNYNFSSGLVHGALKSYVRDFAQRLGSQRAVSSVQAAAQAN